MQRRWVSGCVVLLISAAVASANLLTNPGFEIGTALEGWGQSGWYVGNGADAHSGTNGAAYWVPTGTSSGNYYVALQYVPVTESSQYDLTGWMRIAGTAAGAESFLEVIFHDSSNAWISGSATPHLTTVGVYSQFSSLAISAPVGAVSASVRAVVYTASQTTDQSWHTFDDISFTQAIPEPGTLALCLVGLGFGSIVMHRRRRDG